MKLCVGADEDRPVVATLIRLLGEAGHAVEKLPASPWAVVATEVARRVADGRADQGVVLCWTGTGVSIAANKIAGVRAALCNDAATAAGARQWNDANVLALSLRLLSDPLAEEIVRAWLSTPYEGTEGESLDVIRRSELGTVES